MRDILDCDAAYIAGLVDADGTVTLTRQHSNENRHPSISISNTDKNLLQFVLTTVGAGKITKKRTYKANHTPSFAYTIHNRQALALAKQLQPFLKTYKANRANFILRHYIKVTPRNGKYNSAQQLARRVFEEEFLKIKPRQ